MMLVLDLFSGTKSLEQPCKDLGLDYFSIDNDANLHPDLITDIGMLTANDLPINPDIIWASPPCTAFSVASIGKYWINNNGTYIPRKDFALESIRLVANTIKLIHDLNPTYWFIENPRAMLRVMPLMAGLDAIRHTVTYCQYGDTRMKPTDIWTNCVSWKPRPACKSGDLCHESAPRGSRTGTQGLKNPQERGRVPYALLNEILVTCIGDIDGIK